MKIAYLYRVDNWGTRERFVLESENLGVELVPIKYKELSVKQAGGDWQIYLQGRTLQEFDILYFRAVGSELEWSKLLALYAKKEKITVVDEYLMTDGALRRFKAVAGVMMEEAGVSYPKTVFVESVEELKRTVLPSARWPKGPAAVAAPFKDRPYLFPLIVKGRFGSHGRTVKLVKNKEELEKIFREYKEGAVLIQPKLKVKQWYRCIVVNDEYLGEMRHRQKDKYGGEEGKLMRFNKLKMNKLREICVKAAGLFECDYAGIDVVWDENASDFKILEVNRTAQFKYFEKRTGVNVAGKMIGVAE